jgi:hypothetical protein
MRKVVCTFRFVDGSAAVASLETPCHMDSVPVSYSGAVDALSERPPVATALGLLLWAEDESERLRASLAVYDDGDYDVWEM